MTGVDFMGYTMWKLLMKKEFDDVVVQSFRTKREAEDEIRNRERLVQHLTKRNAKGVYRIQKG